MYFITESPDFRTEKEACDMMRRWISLLMALCLMLGMMTTVAVATETDAPPTEAPPTEAPPTEAPPTEAPPTEAPPTEAPPTEAPPTEPPTEAPTEPPVVTSGSCGDDMHWSFDQATGKLTLSGSGPMDDFEDFPWDHLKDQIKSLEVGSGVRTITAYAFSGCTALKSIRFTGSVLGTIENNAFKNVTATVTYPGLDVDWARTEKKNYGGTLTWKAEVPGGKGGVLDNNLVWIVEGSTLTITGKGNMGGWKSGAENPPWYAYRNDIKKVVMNGNIYCIYTGAFRDMPNLTEVKWPQDLNIIYSSAFYNCTGLTKLEIPNSVYTISDYAFYGCENLKELTLPNALKEIGPGAFMNCKALTKLSIPNGLKTIGKKAFSFTGLKSLILPEGVTKLPEAAFRGCRSLATISFTGDVTSIGAQCFENCTQLKSIQLPASLKSIGESAFAGSGLKEIVFGGDMPTIGSDALKGLSASVFYPKYGDGWSETRFDALNKTYNNTLRFYMGIPDDFAEPTEEPTEAPTEMPTEAPTEVPTEEPSELPEEPTDAPAAVTEPEQPQELPEQPQEQQPTQPASDAEPQKSGILSYWPLAVAGIWFFGGGAVAVWYFLIRPYRKK